MSAACRDRRARLTIWPAARARRCASVPCASLRVLRTCQIVTPATRHARSNEISRADQVTALVASSAELSALSRNLHHLTALLRQGDARPALEYRRMLDTLGGDIRVHLGIASNLLADLRARRGKGLGWVLMSQVMPPHHAASEDVVLAAADHIRRDAEHLHHRRRRSPQVVRRPCAAPAVGQHQRVVVALVLELHAPLEL